MSTLKVNTIQDTTGNDALTIDSSGNVTASQGFVPSTQLSHRNLIINGDMRVAQRGTSVSSSSSNGYYTLDRWRLAASSGTYNSSQQEFTVGQTDVPSQFKYFQRFEATTGNDYQGIAQRIEDVTIVSDTDITISFYAKGTNPGGGSIRLNMRQFFGSGGSTEVDTDDTFIVTSSWQRFEITISLPSISGKTVGTGSYLQLKFDQGSDTSTDAWTLDITGVQLEVGSVATPFEHRSYGEELARCERYYQVVGGVSPSGVGMITMTGWSSSSAYGVYRFPTEMRTSPSLYTNNYPRLYMNGTSVTVTNISLNSSETNEKGCRFSVTATNGGSNWSGWLQGTSGNNTEIQFDAEL